MKTMKTPNKYWVLFILQILMLVLTTIFVAHENPNDETSHYAVKGFEDTHVMIFIGFAFLMTFLKKYSYSALGFNWMLAALAVQWALLCQNFFNMKDGVIYMSKVSILEADILSATVLITFGALLGVASGMQLIFITMFEIAFAAVNFWLVEHIFEASDVGGSMCIHTFGAYFGLGVSLIMNRLKKKKPTDEAASAEGVNDLNGPSYNSDVTAMIGSLFLWVYWPSFNSALTKTNFEYQRAVTNSYLSLVAAVVTTFCMSSFVSHKEGKFDMVHIQNSTLAGGVAIGAVCNMQVVPGVAIAIGAGSGVLSVLGYRYLTPQLSKIGMTDTCGVNNLHGMPGVYSGILSIIFAWLATEAKYGDDLANIFPAMIHGRSSSMQALNQLGALGATMFLSFFSGIFTGLLLKIPLPLSALKEKEKYDDSINWELP